MKFIFSLLYFFVFTFSLFAQIYSSSNKKAIKSFEQAQLAIRARDFDNGILLLNKAVELDPNFIEAHQQLGGNYRMLGNRDKCMEHYAKIRDLANGNPKYNNPIFDLGIMYFEKAQYLDAESCFTIIEKNTKGTFDRNQLFLESTRFAQQALKDTYIFQPTELPKEVNKFVFQSNPQLTADGKQMIFSIRGGMGPQFDEEIAIIELQDGKWTAPKSISENINTKYNEGFATITADGRTIVFTSCNRQDGVGSCDLYQTEKIGDIWSTPINLGPEVNSGAWDSGPSLSADGSVLYFSSERGGGIGGKDLWVSTKNEAGVWQKPENLGPKVNTKYSEVTPFIHADGRTLFFASDGFPGMGGYDMYYAKNIGGFWSNPTNMGSPMNTQHNEGSFFITPNNQKVYFEKYFSLGKDSYSRIFEADLPENLKIATSCAYASGKVIHAKTKLPLAAEVEIIDLKTNKKTQKVKSDEKTGEYLIVLAEGSSYGLFVEKDGYLHFSKHINFETKTFDFKELIIPLSELSSGQYLTLENVFFTTNSYELLPESETELNLIYTTIKQNPAKKFRIEGHTDNAGTKEYNLTLSTKRAETVYNYLLTKGVKKEQISFKGFGETKPKSTNDSEEGKAMNRRIEVVVMN